MLSSEEILSQFTQFIKGKHPNDEQFVNDLKSFVEEIIKNKKEEKAKSEAYQWYQKYYSKELDLPTPYAIADIIYLQYVQDIRYGLKDLGLDIQDDHFKGHVTYIDELVTKLTLITQHLLHHRLKWDLPPRRIEMDSFHFNNKSSDDSVIWHATDGGSRIDCDVYQNDIQSHIHRILLQAFETVLYQGKTYFRLDHFPIDESYQKSLELIEHAELNTNHLLQIVYFGNIYCPPNDEQDYQRLHLFMIGLVKYLGESKKAYLFTERVRIEDPLMRRYENYDNLTYLIGEVKIYRKGLDRNYTIATPDGQINLDRERHSTYPSDRITLKTYADGSISDEISYHGRYTAYHAKCYIAMLDHYLSDPTFTQTLERV